MRARERPRMPIKWQACVQVRQKVEHKRTFLFLEQLILKHSMEVNAIGVKSQPDGLDFYYAHRSHGLKMVDFIGSVLPIRSRNDKQLVSHDANDNTYNYRFTLMVEIVPMCREDLVFASEDQQKFWRHWTGGFVHESWE